MKCAVKSAYIKPRGEQDRVAKYRDKTNRLGMCIEYS